jgi:hypothetical protein
MRAASRVVKERELVFFYRVQMNEGCFTGSSGERQLVLLLSTAE